MRYLEGVDPVAATELSTIDPGWVVSTAVYGILLGVGFTVVGLKARQSWLAIWGASLVVASIAYLIANFVFGI